MFKKEKSERVIACRRRLQRRKRSMRRATGQRETGLPAVGDAHPVEKEDILNDAEARTRQTGRTLIPEVDRRPALRAR
ncbi:MAG: hypothetical protein WCF57_02920 [Pyrinomonadaceae bacterium]